MFLKVRPPCDPLSLETFRRCLVCSVHLYRSPGHVAAPSR